MLAGETRTAAKRSLESGRAAADAAAAADADADEAVRSVAQAEEAEEAVTIDRTQARAMPPSLQIPPAAPRNAPPTGRKGAQRAHEKWYNWF